MSTDVIRHIDLQKRFTVNCMMMEDVKEIFNVEKLLNIMLNH